ncbi:hypothetical protein OMO38_20195, partial [Chryseobacterium sp. 09-1422]
GRYLSIKETSVFILLLLLFWLIFLTKLLIYFASCKLTIETTSFFVADFSRKFGMSPPQKRYSGKRD